MKFPVNIIIPDKKFMTNQRKHSIVILVMKDLFEPINYLVTISDETELPNA